MRYLALVVSLGFVFQSFSAQAGDSVPSCVIWQSIPLNAQTIETEYDGYGRVEFLTDGSLHLLPKASVSQSETHAALALVKTPAAQARYAYRVTYENVRALRSPAANAWEVFWLFYDYEKMQNGKKTNYFIFKPNGVETGTASAEVAQSFLQTATSPQAQQGKSYELTLVRDRNRSIVSVDGAVVSDLTSNKLNKITTNGQLGLYTEDGDVLVKNLQVCTQFN